VLILFLSVFCQAVKLHYSQYFFSSLSSFFNISRLGLTTAEVA